VDRHQVVHELYLTHAADLVVQVYGLTGDYGEAQDVVHETFARALTTSTNFDELDNPRAWLSVVALNLSRSAARRRRVHDRLVRSGRLTAPLPAPGMSPDRVAVVAALQRVSQRLREAVVLHYLVDLPVDEVASILGITASAVRSRLQRGREELAVLLRDWSPAELIDQPEIRDGRPRVEEFRNA
jgi:RNA polymerase sigma factor (sigma-70 family)